jgi:hypothetical protein
VTRYPVIADPPVLAAVVHLAVALITPPGVPDVARKIPGAPGVVAGMTPADSADCGLLPIAFTATTRKLTVWPLVRPVTVMLVAVPGAWTVRDGPGPAPVNTWTSYRVIGDPPLLAGAVQLTTAEALPRTGIPMVGAPGTPTGVTEAERADEALLPTALTATTPNVYVVPLVRPVTVMLIAVAGAWTVRTGVVALPTNTCTSNRVIGDPPLLAGGDQFTTAAALPPVGVPMTGAPGTVAGATGVTALDGSDTGLRPTALRASTRKV